MRQFSIAFTRLVIDAMRPDSRRKTILNRGHNWKIYTNIIILPNMLYCAHISGIEAKQVFFNLL